MQHFPTLKKVLLFLNVFFSGFLIAQPSYSFSITSTKEICLKASAALKIEGANSSDKVKISWSNGKNDVKQISELSSGDYQVNINIEHQQDTLVFITDTTLYFSIQKELCKVSVDNYFSPNDDNYHDVMGVSNTNYYPNFELNVFNKWGQQVHKQKNTYTPWDGKWNGIPLPDGAYFYVFFYDSNDKSKLIKGDVTILR